MRHGWSGFQYWSFRIWLVGLWLLSVPARADDLTYTKLDNATVRVFSFRGVAAQRIRGATGREYVVAVPEGGHGTGLLVSANGLVLTARHVIKDAKIVAVQFPDEDRPVAARVVYSDSEHDYAYLAVAGNHPGFVPIPERKPKLSVRQTVYVIGYPLDAARKRPQSQQGIVSGVLPDGSLQLGIALNPGNSGGPVVDAEEHLVGVAVARADPSSGAQGIGVAVALEHILAGYARTQKGGELKAAKAALAKDADGAQREATLLGALLTEEDATEPYRAIRGKKGAEHASASVDRAVEAALADANHGNADALALAAASAWNSAAVMLERKKSPREYLDKARGYAERAKKADPDIGKRSPFVAFALDDHDPNDVDAGLPQAEGEDGENTSSSESGEDDPRDTIRRSLQTEKNFPTIRIGPSVQILQAPFQVVGVGVLARMMFADRISIAARYQFGLHLGENERIWGHYFDVAGGLAVASWKSHTTSQLVVDIEQMGNTTVYRYVPGEVPTSHALVVEGGILSGQVNLQSRPPPPAVSNDLIRQVFVLQAGVRYLFFYHANSDYLAKAARRSFEASAHVLLPPLNVPENSANADGNPVKTVPGFRADISWDGLFSIGQYELGGGYFPGADWIYARLGWSYLFY